MIDAITESIDQIVMSHKYDEVVVYCYEAGCPRSGWCMNILTSLGFTKVYDMYEGWAGWLNANYPTQ